MEHASMQVRLRQRVSTAILNVSVWLFPALLILSMWSFASWFDTEQVINLLGILGIVHAVIGFLRHGGARVTAAGAYLLGSAYFIMLPALPIPLLQTLYTEAFLYGVVIAYIAQIVLYACFWRNSAAEPSIHQVHKSGLAHGVAAPGLAAVAVLVAVAGALIVTRFAQDPNGFNNATGSLSSSGHVLTASGAYVLVALTLMREGNLFPKLIISGLFFLATFSVTFSGGGRLTLVVAGFYLLVLATRRHHVPSLKPMVMVASPILLIGLALMRSVNIAKARGVQETGLESVVAPGNSLAQIMYLHANGGLEPVGPSGYLAAVTAWVPRFLWPDKPVGFGRQLTEVLHPELLDAGHSEAASFYGECLFNLGPMGIVVGVIAIGLAIRWLDRWLDREEASVNNALGMAVVATLVSGVLNIVWGGLNVYVVREGFRVCAMFGMAGLVRLLDVRRGQQRPMNFRQVSLARQRARQAARLPASRNATL